MYSSRTPGSNITDQGTEPFYGRVSEWRQFAQVGNSFNGNIRYFRFVLVNMLVLSETLRAMKTARRPGSQKYITSLYWHRVIRTLVSIPRIYVVE